MVKTDTLGSVPRKVLHEAPYVGPRIPMFSLCVHEKTGIILNGLSYIVYCC